MRAPALVVFLDRRAGVAAVVVQSHLVPPKLGGAREDAALRSAPCAAWCQGTTEVAKKLLAGSWAWDWPDIKSSERLT